MLGEHLDLDLAVLSRGGQIVTTMSGGIEADGGPLWNEEITIHGVT